MDGLADICISRATFAAENEIKTIHKNIFEIFASKGSQLKSKPQQKTF